MVVGSPWALSLVSTQYNAGCRCINEIFLGRHVIPIKYLHCLLWQWGIHHVIEVLLWPQGFKGAKKTDSKIMKLSWTLFLNHRPGSTTTNVHCVIDPSEVLNSYKGLCSTMAHEGLTNAGARSSFPSHTALFSCPKQEGYPLSSGFSQCWLASQCEYTLVRCKTTMEYIKKSL